MSIEVVNAQPGAPSTGVSWAAIMAGAAAAVASSLSLAVLGAGFGLTLVSPWAGGNASATTFAMSAAIGLIVVQWLSAGLGGYIAGRLRPDWADFEEDERFFRDTAHGFVTWCLATIVVAALAVMSAGAVGRAGAEAARGVSAVSSAAISAMPDNDYLTDMIYRGAPQSTPENRAEALRIMAASIVAGDFSADDRAYLAQLATRAGLSQDEATRRIDAVVNRITQTKAKIQETAEQARKTASRAALFTFLSLLIGAFIASAAAALGGSLRDV